jgi:hypothetical protein
MRILGTLLLIFGLLLCVSIVWAAIGFLMMSFGLICFLIVGERNKRARKLNKQRVDSPDVKAPEPTVIQARQDENLNATALARDRQKWMSLIQNDADLARIVDALTPYGQKYVDELARAYLVLDDKDYLPMILKKIVSSARKDAGQQSVESKLAAPSTPGPQTVNSGPEKDLTLESRQSRARQLQALYGVVKDTPTVALKAPQSHLSLEPSPSTSPILSARRASAAVRAELLLVDSGEKGPHLASNSASGPVSFDNDDNLTALLTRLDTRAER